MILMWIGVGIFTVALCEWAEPSNELTVQDCFILAFCLLLGPILLLFILGYWIFEKPPAKLAGFMEKVVWQRKK